MVVNVLGVSPQETHDELTNGTRTIS